MPPKPGRQAARGERATVRQLDQLDLGARVSSSASAVISRDGNPRNPVQTPGTKRNYTPTVSFDPIKVTIILGSGNGNNFEALADVEKIGTTMGRTATVGQIQGLITSHKAVYQILKDVYDIAIPPDYKSTTISFTDAAAYRHRVDFESRWLPDSDFTIWAGEVESGDFGAKRACECGTCGGIHGAEIEVYLDAAKVRAA